MVQKAWPELVKAVKGPLGWRLSAHLDPITVVPPDILVIAPKPGYNSEADAYGTPEVLENLKQALQGLIHRTLTIRYERSATRGPVASESRASESRRADALTADPMVQKVVELFEARTVQLDYDDPEPASPS